MSFVTAALIGAGGALVGGYLSSQGAKSAAAQQSAAAQNANQLQWNMFQQQQQNQAPWLQVGTGAIGQLGNLMGINNQQNFNVQKYLQDNPQAFRTAGSTDMPSFNTADTAWQDYLARYGQGGNSAYFNQPEGFGSMAKPFSMADFQMDPGAQFRIDQANRALERSGASRGMALSGAQLKGMADYNQGAASQEYQNAYNRFMQNRTTQFGELSNLAGLGQSATGQIGSMGMQTAGQMGQNLTGIGNAQAAGTIGSANAWTNALNTGMNAWNQYNMLGNMGGGNYSITGVPGSSSPNFGNNWGQPVPTVPVG